MRFKDFDCAESNDFVTCEKCFTMSDFCFNEDFLASDAFCAIDEQRLLMDLFENPRTNKQTLITRRSHVPARENQGNVVPEFHRFQERIARPCNPDAVAASSEDSRSPGVRMKYSTRDRYVGYTSLQGKRLRGKGGGGGDLAKCMQAGGQTRVGDFCRDGGGHES